MLTMKCRSVAYGRSTPALQVKVLVSNISVVDSFPPLVPPVIHSCVGESLTTLAQTRGAAIEAILLHEGLPDPPVS